MKAYSMFSRMKDAAASCLVLFALLLASGKAEASGILYQFNTPFPTDASPTGAGPWLDASFQNVSPGTVNMTLTAVNFAAGEYITGGGANGGIFFNLNPSDNPTQLVFTEIASKGSFGTVTVNKGANSFKANGAGKFDLQVDFSGQFSANDSITYKITGITGLTAADFSYLSQSAGACGPFYAAAEIQGIMCVNGSWIEPGGGPVITQVPEPASLSLLAASACLWAAWRMRPRQIKS